MKQSFFNQLLHLMQERPLQGKRMLGLPPEAPWELWQPLPNKTKPHDAGTVAHTSATSWGAIPLPNGNDLVDGVIGEKGPRSDSKLLEQTQAELPEGIPFVGDKTYVGRDPTSTPKQKPPKGALTQAQKDENQRISQQWV